MHQLQHAVAILLALLAGVGADLCASGATEIAGNWYCQAVDAIQYTNVGTAGTYSAIVSMNPDGTCSSTQKSFSGPISPFDEEVSLHFRGPLHLKQLAAYTPSSSTKAKRNSYSSGARRHGHHHYHKESVKKGTPHHQKYHKRQEVVATIDGQVVSWENNWFGQIATSSTDPTATATPQMVTATIDGQVVSWVNNWVGDVASTPALASPQPETSTSANIAAPSPSSVAAPVTETSSPKPAAKSYTLAGGPGVYERIGYYDSATQTLDNLVFLGNHGGQGSGVFDYLFGASLAYTNCNATGGASSPQILSDNPIPSDTEFAVLLGQECNDDCGFVRPGSVAYHGFDGADKVFLLEFSMPMDDTSGFNADMPAIWILNAQIPRTVQYGNAACSCWESGCGEFDIAETLSSGSLFLKSTLHATERGGDSDYFVRPTSGTIKLAVVFSSTASTIHLQILPDDTDFSSSLTTDEIDTLCQSGTGDRVSLFAIT